MSVSDIISIGSPAGQAAVKAARERPAGKVRPGWWVFTHGCADRGSWSQVAAVTAFIDQAGRAAVRLAVRENDGRRHEVEAVTGWTAWCLTTAEARRAGLT